MEISEAFVLRFPDGVGSLEIKLENSKIWFTTTHYDFGAGGLNPRVRRCLLLHEGEPEWIIEKLSKFLSVLESEKKADSTPEEDN